MDAETFAAQAVGLHARLAKVAMAMCGDRALAEECAQEALMKAWERVDAGAELRSLEAWTVTVTMNTCRSQLRRRGAEHRALQRAPEPAAQGITSLALGDDVQRAVLALPRRQQEAVVLHYLADLGIDTIAEATGSSPGAVKNALFHARTALARTLRSAGHDISETDPTMEPTDRAEPTARRRAL